MISQAELLNFQVPKTQAEKIIAAYTALQHNPPQCWNALQKLCFNPRIPFSAYEFLYTKVYAGYPEPHAAWFPDPASIQETHISQACADLHCKDYQALFRWASDHREAYWEYVIKKLNIRFKTPYEKICDLSQGVAKPRWLAGAQLNIVESCFQAEADRTAIYYMAEDGTTATLTYGELEKQVNGLAHSIAQKFEPGDYIAIDMPMNIEAVIIYLGIIKAGCAVVSIADSFAPNEIATRLRITQAKAIFTQDYQWRAGKRIPLYAKVLEANAPLAIVIKTDEASKLRPGDRLFNDFISDRENFSAVARMPDSHSNILFSSGTTGDPKAIPWTHTTPIKAAADAYFHQDIKPEDILVWPTNLGWMMGPWLIYAALINRASLAIYGGAPTQAEFGEFIETSGATVLGLVPSIVNTWYTQHCMEAYDWSRIKCFSSTGECSSADEYLYLMWLADNKPVIEYCGGTEIGGAYITGTLVQAAAPATFTTAALGLDFTLLDEQGAVTPKGEVALLPPSIGLSNELLNRDHDEVYFAGMPNASQYVLRRHGDQIEKIHDFAYRALGRVDDTMNLGGIKTSSAEIERVLNTLPEVKETAAIAVSSPKGGPSKLVIYAVLNHKDAYTQADLLTAMQQCVKSQLNPLFKIYDVMLIEELPRTASNKVMRRVLRDQYPF